MEKALINLKLKYSNLRLKDKISIMMILLLLLLCTALCVAEIFVFAKLFRQEIIRNSEEWLDVSTEAFNQEWSRIYANFLALTTSQDFTSKMNEAVAGEISNITFFTGTQQFFENIKNNATTIKDLYIVFPNGNILKFYDSIPRNTDNPLLDFSYLDRGLGIAFHEETESPFVYGNSVIPITFDMKLLGSPKYLSISKQESPDFIIVFLLDADRIRAIINNTRSTLFSSENNIEFNGSDILKSTNLLEHTIEIEKASEMSGLKVTMNIMMPSFMPQFVPIIGLSLLCYLAVTIIGIIAIRYISKFLTTPFNKMMRILNDMKNGTYKGDVKPRFSDETGTLIVEMNDMYRTIWAQTERIKKEEKQKYRYLSAMLAEEINPHFLYNALEAINMEISRGENNEASEMITDLAQFLRTLLNKGNQTITLANEIVNVSSYMRIMNRRLNRTISLSIKIEEGLQELEIPKTILQPLVENSIIHGFDNTIEEILSPEISINISQADGNLLIEVIDNGSGIDVSKVQDAINNDSPHAHVGLKNIYIRLRLHFGNVDFKIFSYPFFENKILILIKDYKNPQ